MRFYTRIASVALFSTVFTFTKPYTRRITPNTDTFTQCSFSGCIMYLSSCYVGGASDRFINEDSGFNDLLERDDVVMADRGFQI